MADQDAAEKAPSPSMVARAWNSLMRDGTLKAAFRQGADEIGIALKAFPDSIHASEPGGLLDPTQGEIAADRKPPSPSEIARDKQPYRMEQEQDQDMSRGR